MKAMGTDTRIKVGVWVVGLAPVVWATFQLSFDGLGANPIEALLHLAGRWGLVFHSSFSHHHVQRLAMRVMNAMPA